MTNVTKKFLGLINKHFPAHHKLHKILNRNTVKVSYSCFPSVSSYISGNNIAVLRKYRSNNETPRECNCTNAERCPFNGKCLTPASIYGSTIHVPNGARPRYIGLSEPVIKARWSDHMTSCSDKKYRNKTKLSHEFWRLKDSGHELNSHRDIKFEILKKSVPYRAGAKKCNLCLWEKLLIMKNERDVVNKRDEFVNKCQHSQKFMLSNYKRKRRRGPGSALSN